ncbi:MAG: hypothetical protein WCF33_12660 [Pseudonocardiaceae bacterium]
MKLRSTQFLRGHEVVEGDVGEPGQDRIHAGLDTEQAAPQATLTQLTPEAGTVDVPAAVGVRTGDLVDPAGGLPPESRGVQDFGHRHRTGYRVGSAADELLIDQIEGSGDPGVTVEHRTYRLHDPPEFAGVGAPPGAFVAPWAKRAEVCAASRGFELSHTPVVERGREKIEFGEDVGLRPIGHSGGLAVPTDGQGAGALRRTGAADPAHQGELEVAVPVAQDVGDGWLARTTGDQQPRVSAQQQAFVACREATAGEHERSPSEVSERVKQPGQQVVLAERRGDPEDVGTLGTDRGRDVVEGDSQLHVHQLHLPGEGGASGPGQIADGQGETGKREVLRVVQSR